MNKVFIEADEFYSISKQSHAKIIDLGSFLRYKNLHIPKALHCNNATLFSEVAPFGIIKDPKPIINMLEDLGVTHNTVFLLYDDVFGSLSGRFIWILNSLGFNNCFYLNGSLKSYIQTIWQLSKTIAVAQRTSLNIEWSNQFTANKEYILANLNNNNVVIWDARDESEFLGKTQYALRAGHIPGAINLNWLQLINSNDKKLIANADKLLENKAISREKEIIVHCQTHRRSGFAYMLLKHLNYPNVKAYAGSWNEWGNDVNLPIET